MYSRGRGWSVDQRMGFKDLFQHMMVCVGLVGALNWWTRGSLNGDVPAGQERDVRKYTLPDRYLEAPARKGFAGGDDAPETIAAIEARNRAEPSLTNNSLFGDLREDDQQPTIFSQFRQQGGAVGSSGGYGGRS